jgi:glycosyltransferase involved in cell wall biosynthesis
MKTGLRVLVSAYSCQPGHGSEPGVGWDWIRQIARFHEVWAITRANNRDSIEQALAREPLPNLHFIYFDFPAWARFWKRGSRGVALYYYLWQAGIYRIARRIGQAERFDLVHHITFGKYWAPSFLCLLDAPFIWGPVGGGESAPGSFWRGYGWRGRLYECSRNVVRRLSEFDPFVRMTARRSVMGLAKTPETAKRMERLGCRSVKVYSEVSLPREEIAALSLIPQHRGTPIRLISTGRLLHWKGFHLALQAFATVAREFPDARYTLVGDGPERTRLEQLAASLSISDRVSFLGAVPRETALAQLAVSDIVLHPSLHDSSGWVCIEAMAAGRPVVCLDCGGPAQQVTDETAIKVSATTSAAAVDGIAAAILRLAQNPDLRRGLGEAGRQRVAREFASESRAVALAAIYSEAIGQPRATAFEVRNAAGASARQ